MSLYCFFLKELDEIINKNYIMKHWILNVNIIFSALSKLIGICINFDIQEVFAFQKLNLTEQLPIAWIGNTLEGKSSQYVV